MDEHFVSNGREHNGDGDEIIFTPQLDKVVVEKAIVAGGVDIGPIKIQDIICQGHIKAEKRWSGDFLVPVQDGFTTKLMLQQYRDGKLLASSPFPVARLALNKEQADFDGWLWISRTGPLQSSSDRIVCPTRSHGLRGNAGTTLCRLRSAACNANGTVAERRRGAVKGPAFPTQSMGTRRKDSDNPPPGLSRGLGGLCASRLLQKDLADVE